MLSHTHPLFFPTRPDIPALPHPSKEARKLAVLTTDIMAYFLLSVLASKRSRANKGKKAGAIMAKRSSSFRLLFVLFGLTLLPLLGCASAPNLSTPSPPEPVDLGGRLAKIHCPDAIATNRDNPFDGVPCDATAPVEQCTSACTPLNQPTFETLPTEGVDERCKQSDTLCVGSAYDTRSLDEIAKKLDDNPAIQIVLFAAERFEGTLSLNALQRPLTLEGVSNDPQQGTILIAPQEASPTEEYASLRLQSQSDITLKRLRLQGGGHGLLIEKARNVTLHDVVFHANALSGLWIQEAENLRLERCQITQNGATREAEGTLSRFRFGAKLEKIKDTEILSSEISRNGAGGLLLWLSSKAIGITNDHRPITYERLGIGITNDHKVALRGNLIHHNGPVSKNDDVRRDGTCKAACPNNGFCEGGVCHPSLIANEPSIQGARGLFGVGVFIAGIGKLDLHGNSFFGNDTSGLIAHSLGSVTLQQNAFERNGVRPFASKENADASAYPAAHLWGISENLQVTENLFHANLDTGLRVGCFPTDTLPNPKTISNVRENIFSAQGLARTQDGLPQGIGLRFAYGTGDINASLTLESNAFFDNGSSSFALTGSSKSLNLRQNTFTRNRLRAITLHDARFETANLINNQIDGATGYAVQMNDSEGSLTFEKNIIKNVSNAPNGEEADGIHLSQNKGTLRVSGNSFTSLTRAAIFANQNNVVLGEGNLFSNAAVDLASLGEASFTSDSGRETPPVPATSVRSQSRKIELP